MREEKTLFHLPGKNNGLEKLVVVQFELRSKKYSPRGESRAVLANREIRRRSPGTPSSGGLLRESPAGDQEEDSGSVFTGPQTAVCDITLGRTKVTKKYGTGNHKRPADRQELGRMFASPLPSPLMAVCGLAVEYPRLADCCL